jgi:hypothetical protein
MWQPNPIARGMQPSAPTTRDPGVQTLEISARALCHDAVVAESGAASRVWIGVFTALVAIAIAPLSMFTGFLGFFVACFGDQTSAFCNADDPDAIYLTIFATPVLLMLLVGTIATVRRSWRLAALGAGLSVLAMVAWFVIAIAIGENNTGTY